MGGRFAGVLERNSRGYYAKLVAIAVYRDIRAFLLVEF